MSSEVVNEKTAESTNEEAPPKETPKDVPAEVTEAEVPQSEETPSYQLPSEGPKEEEPDEWAADEISLHEDTGEPEITGEKTDSEKSDRSRLNELVKNVSMVSDYSRMVGEEEDQDLQILSDKDLESMVTQAGSYNSTTSSSFIEGSIDMMLPKTFQDYITKYSSLFGRTSGKDEAPCDEEAGKTFLKIDLKEIVSGYEKQDKLCRDVKTSLKGMVRTRPDLICIENESIVVRKDYKSFKGVRIVSGGHMGLEPLYIDYIGKGLLTGAVIGSVSDPPSVGSVTTALWHLAQESPGLLIIIQNNVEYRLVFGLAMERVRMQGFINIDMITVADDSFERCKSPVGRRGLGGIVLLFKLAGSMAECGKTLREVYVAVRNASKSMVTISCMTKPFKAIGTGLDKNSKDGIHFNGDACQMVKHMLDYCLHPMKYFSMRLEQEDNAIVFINNYRTKTPEFYTIVEYIVKDLEKRGVRIERLYAENFVTGFWPGFSITLMMDCNEERARYLDAPCYCHLWPRKPGDGLERSESWAERGWAKFPEMGPILTKTETRIAKNAVITACKAMVLCENVLNAMHFFGNYGTKLRLGAETILQHIRQSKLNFSRPFNLLIEISDILIETLPGVMGALYGCLFEGAARSFLRSPLTTLTAENWCTAMDEALRTLRAYSNARGGIVSLALSLIPVVSALHGPYLRLVNNSTKNPVLNALDSLKKEIEERANVASGEKESLLKNQLDVESYALMVWLHAVFSSVYWKGHESKSSLGLESVSAGGDSPTLSSVSVSQDEAVSSRKSSAKKAHQSLEFLASSAVLNKVSLSASLSSESSSKSSQSAKIFT